MPIEIERKFLVNTDVWEPMGTGEPYKQGYISSNRKRIVRVRVAGEKAFLCIKSIMAIDGDASGTVRREFEYEIPMQDAEELLRLYCKKPFIEKTRHKEMHNGKLWEIDVFHGENDGLVVAEVELLSEGEGIALPGFVEREVSTDHRYFNASLQKNPFSNWR
jgi:adenylate cyclase